MQVFFYFNRKDKVSMSKVRIRKYQLKAILEHMRDNMGFKTIDDVITYIQERTK